MTQAGVPVPRVVAFGSTRALAGRRTSALVSVTPDRFATLGAHAHRVLVRGQGAREALFDDVGQLLALLRRIHEAGLFHGDVNLGNVLFDPAARAFCFIDFHRCGARPDPRERADDLGKLHEFLERWIPWEPWLAAMRAHYFGGDSELEAQVLAVWHALHRARVRGKVEGTVRNALEGKHRFARRRVGKAVVTWAVESAHGAEELVAFAREGAPADVRVLGEYRDTREARRAWAQAVGAAAEEAQEVVPVALVELEDPSRALLLGQKGFDPTYTLRWVFSLERFAAPPQARRDAPG
jgi:tRNA A-37 threonylcarbamoyl transferase component Bud32